MLSDWRVISGIVAVAAVPSLLISVAAYRCRQRYKRRRHAYERVNHELDAEEREFKKAMEGRGDDDDNGDADDADSDARPDDDDDFSEAQTAQLEMIEKYRSSLLEEKDGDLV